jgi:hypothetical protein
METFRPEPQLVRVADRVAERWDVLGLLWDVLVCPSASVLIMVTVGIMTQLVSWARDLAAARMATPLPTRWAHVQAVAAKAEGLRPVLGGDADLLVAAAWLHDIGYAPSITDTGFHPLDGARYIASLVPDDRLARLIANHSGARYEAGLRDLHAELAEYPDEHSLARDALWYADMTTSPEGLPVTFEVRLAEIRHRYGPEHSVPRAITAAADDIRVAIAHVARSVTAFDGQRR